MISKDVDREETSLRVRAILKETLCLDEAPSEGDHLVADLNADSLDMLDSIFHLEAEYDIAIGKSEWGTPSEGGKSDATVSELIDFVVRKRLAAAPAVA